MRAMSTMSSSDADIPGLRCPDCDAEGLLPDHIEYNVEHFGSVLLNVITCPSTGYRHGDVLTLTSREPISLKAYLNSIEDLDIKVIKPSTATTLIPEFTATITPRRLPSIELSMNVKAFSVFSRTPSTFVTKPSLDDPKKEERMLKQIRLAREGTSKFTIVINDSVGNCALVSPI